LRIVRGRRHERTHAPHPLGLLRARRERPRGYRAAEQRDELTTFHVAPVLSHRKIAHASVRQEAAALQDFDSTDVRFGSKAAQMNRTTQ
jgi:hypothetical protein